MRIDPPWRRLTRRRSSLAGRATGGRIITVEDHYAAGGIGDAVDEAVSEAGIRVPARRPRNSLSGKPEELLDRFGISANHIISMIKRLDEVASRQSPVVSR